MCELNARRLGVLGQGPLALCYKGQIVGEYLADVLVENCVLLELTAQSRLSGVEDAQLLNYLTISGLRVGMLVNFTYPKAQIRRLVR